MRSNDNRRPRGNNSVATSQEKTDPGIRQDDGFGHEAAPAPTSQQDARALGEVVERFRTLHPADWDQLRLCPLQHGLETMVRKLRAFR